MSFRELCNDFCVSQAKSVKYLERAAQEVTLPKDPPTYYAKLPYDVSIYIKKVSLFLFEVANRQDDPRLQVCEVLNRVVLSNEDTHNAVRRISEVIKAPDHEITQLEQIFAMVIENLGQGIFALAKGAGRPGKSQESENYEAGLAMVKFSQMVNPTRPRSEEPRHFDPWNVPLNSACDVRITTTKAGRESPRIHRKESRKADIRVAIGRLQRLREAPNPGKAAVNRPGPFSELQRLETSIVEQLYVVMNFCEDQLRFAHWWLDFLGGHKYDYCYEQYIEKCRWQAHNSGSFIQRLTRLRQQVAILVGFCNSGPIGKAEVDQFIQLVTSSLVMASAEWYEHMAIGFSGALWSEIEREYGAAVLATERCLSMEADSNDGCKRKANLTKNDLV